MNDPKPFNLNVPDETRLRLFKLRSERRAISEDRPLEHILRQEPNMARLQMAVCRGAFIFGKDHVKLLGNFQQEGIEK
jgi:hypothetical protein